MLDCSDPDSAIETTSAVLGLDAAALAALVRDADDLDAEEVPIGEEMWKRALAKGATSPTESFRVRFFHATRTLAPERFRAEGVHRLSEAIDLIWADLWTLVPGVDNASWREFREALEDGRVLAGSPAAHRYRDRVLRNPDRQGGVYGFLIRSVAVRPPDESHDYCATPEIIEDIVSCAPSDWSLDVRFRAAATPHLVHFSWPETKENALKTALEYAWVSTHGGSLDALTYGVDTGAAVPPEAVLEVEVVTS